MKAKPTQFRLTHPDRVMFTSPPITKRDLFDYYLSVSDRMLPALAGRPISLVRCPGGLRGPCFFQRNPSPGFGDAVKSAKVGKNTVVYIEDLRGLAALVQMNVIEIHAWGAKLDDIERPDQIVLDLDPGEGVAFKRIAAAARLLRERLRKQKLESFVRTSGGKGLHVVIPLEPKADWDTVKAFAHGVATSAAKEHPGEFVAIAGAGNRKDRIFIDYLRNGLAASSVASYSVRARDGAGVATPLAWEELPRIKSASQFNVRNFGARLRKHKRDPWAGFSKLRQKI
ncbi:MAG TPA: non-homologous end-joining DNA ligase [Nevskiaceae bacterium]|nr:non-homologous end-joining DNA ligase [Nevskiaceae bacterium]